MTQCPDIRIGTSGWSYAHWKGLVYPKTLSRGIHPLEYVAGLMNAIEINTSFYQPIRPEVARVWLRKVDINPEFLFTAKLYRKFTHDRILSPTDIASWKEGMFPLLRAMRLGCVLMQFPWSFRLTEENRDFVIKLRRTFHEFPLAAEMRHSSWLSDEGRAVFIDHKITFCNIDYLQQVHGMPPTALLTSGIGYVRLHGRERGSNHLYSAAELEEWAKRIDRIQAHADRTFVIFNNDGGAKAVVNALQMACMIGGVRGLAPAGLLRAYPEELAGFSRASTAQASLFTAQSAA
jgi:uncharacterized protein YecE (DUF72 family)